MSLLRQARQAWGERAVFVAGDVGRLPFERAAFDQVLSIRVLQHVHDLSEAVGGHCILAQDGGLLFSYHNKRNAHRVLAFPKSRSAGSPFSKESAEVSSTLISHHPRRVARILDDANFSAPDYRGVVVIDALARLTERFHNRSPSDFGWARWTGRHELASWLAGSATALHGETLTPAASTDDLLVCPSCRSGIDRTANSFECSRCHARFPIRDGIADFRV